MSHEHLPLDEEFLSESEVAATERRFGDRRKKNIPVAKERRSGNERRRQVDPTTCERDYTHDEIDFMRSMDEYKRLNNRPFPTWSEVLEVLHCLGYRKVASPTPIPGSEQAEEVASSQNQ